ncbi:MAG: hypothetical protein KDA67_12730 [Rhodobacteraceae bacterium]|nr:hypothetical protein [Paracoccaceae bacterium]
MRHRHRIFGNRSWFLSLVFVGLLGSGLLRLGDSRAAIAEEVNSHISPTPVANADLPEPDLVNCASEQAPDALLAAIRRREAQLDARELRLENRIQALKVAELKLGENTNALIAAEKRLAATLAIADSAAENDLARLTTVYESMKPKNAAGLFSEMAPEFAAGFLGRMRSNAAAEILSNLAPGKAYTISLILAGRNARAPLQ